MLTSTLPATESNDLEKNEVSSQMNMDDVLEGYDTFSKGI